jgi:hypothetical protein
MKGNILPPAIAAITRSMKSAPDMSGLTHLARDGVLRRWDGQGKVVDYRQLSNEQVMLLLKAADIENKVKYEEWEGVDGRNVTDEKALWDPEEQFRPTSPKEEEDNKKEESEKCTVTSGT